MGVPRSTWIDDDGSGTKGTVVNNAELQKIYDNIDTYFGSPRVSLAKVTTEQTVSNTTTPTSVFSYSVPGGTLGISGVLIYELTGFVDLTTSSTTLTVTISYGGTNVASGGVITTATSKGPVNIRGVIAANNATNSQRASAQIQHIADGSGTLADAAWSSVANASHRIAQHANLAIDSTIAKTFDVTVTWGAAQATAIFKRWYGNLELVRP